MKKLLVFGIALVAINLSLKAQIEMNSSGNVGIGNTPNSSYKLYVNGQSYFSSFVGIGASPSSPYFLKVGGGFLFYNNGYPAIEAKGIDYEKYILPTSDNTCYLGMEGKRFAEIWTYHLNTHSDARDKENIREIKGALDAILKLRGVTYDLKYETIFPDSLDIKIKDEKYKENKIKKSQNQVGFLAQEVEKVLPNVVSHDDSTDEYGIYYLRIIPIVVEALKEQQAIIENLKDEVATLSNNESKKSGKLGPQDNEPEIQNQLFQNAPNPFTESTVIKYKIAETTQSAMLNIYNMNGTQLKSITIHQTGSGSITLNGNELGAGMYMYTLIADGNIVDTKQMVLTE